MLRIYAHALDRLRVRLNMYLVNYSINSACLLEDRCMWIVFDDILFPFRFHHRRMSIGGHGMLSIL